MVDDLGQGLEDPVPDHPANMNLLILFTSTDTRGTKKVKPNDSSEMYTILLPNLLLVVLEMAAYGYLSSIMSLKSFVEASTLICAVIQAVLWISSAKVQ